MMCGATGGGNRGGAAYVFRLRGGAWFHEWELLQAVPAGADGFGLAVAIERNTVLVGSPQDDWFNLSVPLTDGGSVYEFQPYPFVDGFESGDTTEWSSSVP